MPNNNPQGVNGLYQQEAAYGTIKRLEQTTKEVSTPSTPAMNAPRRAQRAAVNGRSRTAQAQAPTPEDYQAAVAQVWASFASLPGASDLVKQYAARAQGMIQNAGR